MCGYLNLEVAERLGVCAATVSGVNSFEDVLEAEVKAVTTKAPKLGVKTGMRRTNRNPAYLKPIQILGLLFHLMAYPPDDS